MIKFTIDMNINPAPYTFHPNKKLLTGNFFNIAGHY